MGLNDVINEMKKVGEEGRIAYTKENQMDQRQQDAERAKERTEKELENDQKTEKLYEEVYQIITSTDPHMDKVYCWVELYNDREKGSSNEDYIVYVGSKRAATLRKALYGRKVMTLEEATREDDMIHYYDSWNIYRRAINAAPDKEEIEERRATIEAEIAFLKSSNASELEMSASLVGGSVRYGSEEQYWAVDEELTKPTDWSIYVYEDDSFMQWAKNSGKKITNRDVLITSPDRNIPVLLTSDEIDLFQERFEAEKQNALGIQVRRWQERK